MLGDILCPYDCGAGRLALPMVAMLCYRMRGYGTDCGSQRVARKCVGCPAGPVTTYTACALLYQDIAVLFAAFCNGVDVASCYHYTAVLVAFLLGQSLKCWSPGSGIVLY